MKHIKIKEIGIYHPKKVVDNAYYEDYFKEKGKDVSNFLKHMGRKKRYIIDNEDENGLTMGIQASKDVLQRANMSGKDIDMIVFSTQVPETTFPSNAMFLHHEIGAGYETIVMDQNANCAGMMVAVEQATRYMMANPHVNTALIVGSDYNTLISNPDEEVTYANYGDAACAIILETTDEETGFIDAIYHTDSVTRDKIMYPEQGLTKAIRDNADMKNIKWLPFKGKIALPPTYKMIETLLDRNQLKTSDIKAYCLSQFTLSNILKIQEEFQLDDQQIIYVGDRFGYTGTSSPFLALYEGINSGRINRGDYVLFWTIGAGFQLVSMLFKY
ncbi:ketoacyl-ACP synthase III [Metabacillus malikii]|uniref:3-oxoacyl-[acyl-carrier-protein] synthase-3 n=1 Tax=Metabacillus malikii TaxID=1504265 RepID=A0ABT9ZET1_9BACI|nr:ketoacyl-ACP synthase III [Metabacillus malikii]MDQ0230346.1 3-oxoacyl-[acyl-carrier-protein] synthase-3 [Metabacillus malikii]